MNVASKCPQPPTVLTIAGSDSGGCAGIQADLKTFAEWDVHGASVLTAVTAQNTVGVFDVCDVPASGAAAQLDAVLDDFDVRAAKTGMLGRPELLEVVAARSFAALVVDPVMIATSGAVLYSGDPHDYLRLLAPHTTVLTPNLPEAAALLGRSSPDRSVAAARDMAAELGDHGPRAVVVKGGHADGPDSVDVVWCDGELLELSAPRIDTVNVHGTGCTFSATVAAELAVGASLPQAIGTAKEYVAQALAAAADWRLGAGSGPVHHNCSKRSR